MTARAEAQRLRKDAATARTSYPEALGKLRADSTDTNALHAEALIVQAVGFEIAAGLHEIAAAIRENTTMGSRRR